MAPLPEVKLPTREEMLAMDLPIEVKLRDRGRGMTYRYASQEDAVQHLTAEREVMRSATFGKSK